MQLEIEREALRKKKKRKERLESSRKSSPTSRRTHNLLARWQQEKEAIQRQRTLKEELERLRLDIERAQRAGDYGKASELQYGRLPELEGLMRADDERMAAAKQGQAMLKEEVDEEDIAAIVSKWTHIPSTIDGGGNPKADSHGRSPSISVSLGGQSRSEPWQTRFAARRRDCRIRIARLAAHLMGPTGVRQDRARAGDGGVYSTTSMQ